MHQHMCPGKNCWRGIEELQQPKFSLYNWRNWRTSHDPFRDFSVSSLGQKRRKTPNEPEEPFGTESIPSGEASSRKTKFSDWVNDFVGEAHLGIITY